MCFYSDIKFVIGPNRKAIYGHRCILAARCDVFRAMFSDKQNKDASAVDVPFVLSDTTPDIFLPLLEFIYTNSVTLNHKIVRLLPTLLSIILFELYVTVCWICVQNTSKGMSCKCFDFLGCWCAWIIARIWIGWSSRGCNNIALFIRLFEYLFELFIPLLMSIWRFNFETYVSFCVYRYLKSNMRIVF